MATPNFPNTSFPNARFSLRGFFLVAGSATHLKPSDGVRATEKALDKWHPKVNHSLSSLRALMATITIKQDRDKPDDNDEDEGGQPDDNSGGPTQEQKE
jgi:hypothetical protein